jgi:hypothetical protein
VSVGKGDRRSEDAGKRRIYGNEAFAESAVKCDLSLCYLVNRSAGLQIPGWCLRSISRCWTASRTAIFSDIEVAKISDGCELGPIYATLVAIGDGRWRVCVVHFESLRT